MLIWRNGCHLSADFDGVNTAEDHAATIDQFAATVGAPGLTNSSLDRSTATAFNSSMMSSSGSGNTSSMMLGGAGGGGGGGRPMTPGMSMDATAASRRALLKRQQVREGLTALPSIPTVYT